MNIDNFTPRPGANVGLAATTTSGSTAKLICKDEEVNLLVYNDGSTPVAFAIGGSGVTATYPTTSANGDMIIKGGDSRIIRARLGTGTGIYAAAITGTSTASLFIQVGVGS